MQSLWLAAVVKPKLPERERLCSCSLLSWSRQLVDLDQLALVGPPMATGRHPQNSPQGSSNLLNALSPRSGKKKKTKNEKRSQKGKKNLCLSKDQAACKTNTMQQRTGSCLGGPILKKPTIAHPLSPPQDPWLLSLKETNNSWMQIDMEYNNVMDHLRTHGPHNILFSKLEGDGFHLVDEELLGWSHRASGGQWLKVHTNISDKWYSSGFCTGTCAVTYLH